MASRILLILAKLCLTGALLWLALKDIDAQALWTTLDNVRMDFVITGILVLAIQPLVATVRWRTIISTLGGHLSLIDSSRLTYVGTFLNQALPASIGGDAVKIYLMKRQGHSLRLSANSIALDRVMLLLGLFVLVAAGTPALDSLSIGFRGLLPLIITGIVAGILIICFADRLPKRLHAFRAFHILAAISNDSRQVFLSPKSLTSLVPLVVLSYATMSISIYFFIIAFSEPIGFLTTMFLVPTVLLASVLPISIGGWGAREAAMVAILGLVGISAPTALAASILFGLSSILVTAPGLAMYLTNRNEINTALENETEGTDELLQDTSA